MFCLASILYIKGHSFCKQCLYILQFMKTRSFSPNLSKPARADISCQFMKTRSLCRHCLQNEWTLTYYFKTETFLSSYLWCATAVKLCMPTPWLINFSCAAHISVKLVDNDASDLKLSRKSLLLN